MNASGAAAMIVARRAGVLAYGPRVLVCITFSCPLPSMTACRERYRLASFYCVKCWRMVSFRRLERHRTDPARRQRNKRRGLMAPFIRRRRATGTSSRRRWSLAATAVAVVGSMALAPAAPAKSRAVAAAAAVKGPWIAQDRDPAWRAQKLVDAMTLDEKLAMVHGVGLPLPGAGAGSVPAIARLGIPALALSDGPLGPGNGATGVTQWPDATNQA